MFEGVKAKKISCGNHHTVVKLENSKIFGCGSNSFGQLGIFNGQQSVVEFTEIPINCSTIEQISCGPQISSFLDIFNQTLYQCGSIDEATPISQGNSKYDLKKDVGSDPIVEIRQGHSCTLALSYNGNAYLRVNNGTFERIKQMKNIKEIGAC